MHRPLIFICIIYFIISCNTGQQQPSTVSKPVDVSEAINCYRYINNKDTVMLKTISVNGYITGTLVYNFYEKDKNKGTIRGKMTGDLLVADYTFNAEGMESVRQVAFKKTGTAFIEGYGDIKTINDKAIFKNIDSLDFSHSPVLSEIDCEK